MKPGEQSETLHSYLLRNINAGVLEFSIRAEHERTGGTGVQFRIYPTYGGGDILDFILRKDHENGYDMLFNEDDITPIDIDRLTRIILESYQHNSL